MAIDLSRSLLEVQLRQIGAGHGGLFQEFHSDREYWDSLLHRKAPVQLDATLEAYSSGVDIQTPALERYRGQLVQTLMINPTKVDAISLDPATDAKKDVEDCRLWFATQWEHVDRHRRVDKARAENLVRYGVSPERTFWSEEGEKASDAEEGDDEKDDAQHFRVEVLNPLECAWLPVTNTPDLFIQESEVSYVEATNLRDSDGNWLTLDEAGEVLFLSSRQPVDDVTTPNISEKKLHVVTRVMRDPETGDIHLSEYVYPDGKAVRDSAKIMADVICPTWPITIIPSASESPLESNPTLRYRPTMHPLFVLSQEYNFWRTTIAATGVKYSSEYHDYVDISALRADQVAFLEEIFPTEGAGSARRLVLEKPQPGSTEMAVLPHIEKYPSQLEEAMKVSFEECKEQMREFAPSRFLSGNPSRSEASYGSATMFADMTQAAGLEPSANLAEMDAGTAQQLEQMAACVRYWDAVALKTGVRPKKYQAVGTGETPLWGGGDVAGKVVFVDARKLSRKYQLYVKTNNQTQAEEQLKMTMVYTDKAQDTLTDEQVYARRGFEDPKRQSMELEKDRQRKAFQPFFDQATLKANIAIWTAVTGFNQAALLGLSLPPPPAALPDRAQGAGAEEPPAPPPMQLAQAPIQPTPLQSPSGGNSPIR